MRFARSPFRFFEELQDEFGELTYHRSMGMRFFVAYSPRLIEHVLVRNARNYVKDPFLRGWKAVFGEGLLTAEGDHWKRERRIIQPAFHRERIESYFGLMTDAAEARLDAWRARDKLSAHSEMMALTLEIVARALFGAEIGSDRVARVSSALEKTTRYFVKSSGPSRLWVTRLPVPTRNAYHQGIRELDAIVEELIAEKRRESESSQDLISALLHARDDDGSGLSDRQIRDEVMTLFLAGHETTALALTFGLDLLARNPEAQSRARDELKRAAGEKPLSLGTLRELHYLKAILDETLRLYPPAWVLAREAVADDELGGYPVPAGSNVVIPIWAIHRNPGVFAQPLEFRPERWTAELRQSLPRAAYIPFGYGPRMCIGSHFAIQEALIILASLLRRYEALPLVPRSPELEASITTRPKEDVWLKLEAIGRKPS